MISMPKLVLCVMACMALARQYAQALPSPSTFIPPDDSNSHSSNTNSAGGGRLNGNTRKGWACFTRYIAGDALCTQGACGPNVPNPKNLPCVAIPYTIFNPNTPGANTPSANGNLNPLCGKEVRVRANGVTRTAIITDTNESSTIQDCGVGSCDSFDASARLWRKLRGHDGPLSQIKFKIRADTFL